LGRSPNARQPAKAHVVRYADDFIVTGATRELLAQRVKPAVEEFALSALSKSAFWAGVNRATDASHRFSSAASIASSESPQHGATKPSLTRQWLMA
jgi:hypothetical protein